ncbi:unnamed protein product [Amoebophrya sp. A25]|nr:unnamed protein product [Amoebophrya sp. A25]|eukprot:GSA25T00019277001.1
MPSTRVVRLESEGEENSSEDASGVSVRDLSEEEEQDVAEEESSSEIVVEVEEKEVEYMLTNPHGPLERFLRPPEEKQEDLCSFLSFFIPAFWNAAVLCETWYRGWIKDKKPATDDDEEKKKQMSEYVDEAYTYWIDVNQYWHEYFYDLERHLTAKGTESHRKSFHALTQLDMDLKCIGYRVLLVAANFQELVYGVYGQIDMKRSIWEEDGILFAWKGSAYTFGILERMTESLKMLSATCYGEHVVRDLIDLKMVRHPKWPVNHRSMWMSSDEESSAASSSDNQEMMDVEGESQQDDEKEEDEADTTLMEVEEQPQQQEQDKAEKSQDEQQDSQASGDQSAR